jgi:hypothetical protein
VEGREVARRMIDELRKWRAQRIGNGKIVNCTLKPLDPH